MEFLRKIYSRHNEWIRIVNSFGYSLNSEDIVQDMYIELTEPPTEKGIEDGRVNPDFIGVSNENRVLGEDGKINVAYVCIMLRKCYSRSYKESKTDLTTNIGEGFEFIDKLVTNDERQEALKIYEDNMEKEINTWSNYDALMFRIYKEDGLSLRKLAKETGIHYSSIFTTITNCKKRLQENCKEDYVDIQNGDYELIKAK